MPRVSYLKTNPQNCKRELLEKGVGTGKLIDQKEKSGHD